jgi:hypothetical protein
MTAWAQEETSSLGRANGMTHEFIFYFKIDPAYLMGLPDRFTFEGAPSSNRVISSSPR